MNQNDLAFLQKTEEELKNMTEDEKFAYQLQQEEYNSIMTESTSQASIRTGDQNPYD